MVGRPHRHRVPRARQGRARRGTPPGRGPSPTAPPPWPSSTARRGRPNSRSYSFIADPHPAELTTIASTLRRLERLDRPLREPRRLGRPPGVQRQRPAAALRARDDHVAPLGREHPRGRRVDPREEHRLHAAGEHADHRPPLPARRHPLGEPARRQRPGGAAARAAAPAAAAGDTGPRPSSPPRASSRSAPVRCSRAQRRDRRPQPPRVREQREDRLPVSRSRSGRRAVDRGSRRRAPDRPGPLGRHRRGPARPLSPSSPAPPR